MAALSPMSSHEGNSSDSQPNTLSLVAAQASKITSVSLYSGLAEITRSFKLALIQGRNQITIGGFPRSSQPNTLSLVAAQASKITNVNLYSGLAEITRSFKLALIQGRNQITIGGFPRSLLKDSVRVEGLGNASIHDVIISTTPLFNDTDSLDTSDSFLPIIPKREHQELRNQIASVKHARSTLDAYLLACNGENLAIAQLTKRFTNHAFLARKLDNNILDLERELASSVLQTQMPAEEDEATRLPWRVTIDVWAQTDEDEAEILIIYTVNNANWTASYDIRADTTQSADKNIVIHYKASIRQNTGESWLGVPLTLETVTPALGTVSPSLSPWILAEAKPISVSQPIGITMPRSPGQPEQLHRFSYRERERVTGGDLPGVMPCFDSAPAPTGMEHRPAIVATNNLGNVSATFQIPGLISVPSDFQQHNVTIASFKFKAPLLWYTFPKANARVYMEAKIKNESEYAFIPGFANMYVDGSFVATTSVPAVSPQETFSCPLGLDPSLRVTYHRQEVNNSMTGFYKKSTTKTYTQRITITNTKSTPIENLKVVDTIPVSQDERIEIKLLNPPLTPSPVGEPSSLQRTMSQTSTEKNSISKELKADTIRVSPGVVALWDGTGDFEANQDVVGKNGRVRWDVSLSPQEKINLVLKFDVSYPEKLIVTGT